MRGFTGLQLCKYTCDAMDHRHATLIHIAIFARADPAPAHLPRAPRPEDTVTAG
jgi:hypothetical protein